MKTTNQTNQLQVAKQQIQLQRTCRGGNDIHEIETICELPKVQYFDSVYFIEKIKDRKYQANFKQLLGGVLTKISVLSGFKNEIDQFTKQDLVKMLTTAYSDISIEEIYKAFELERYGIYEKRSEHYQQFNSEYISEVLKKYKIWKVREKQLLNYSPPPKESVEVTEEIKLKVRNEFLKTVFENITENDFYDYAWLLYDELEKSGKINVSIEEKKELYNRELVKYKPQKTEEIRTKATYSAKHVLSDFQKKLDSGKPLAIVQNICKSIIVSNYLKKHIKNFETFKNAIINNQ